MGQNLRLLVIFIFLICDLCILGNQLKAQTENKIPDPLQTPIDIQFTLQMNRSQKDYRWSQTYFNSYRRTKEVPYLNLAGEFCLKTINRLSDIQKVLSRTTRFYNQADRKRLEACQFYEKIRKQSLLLELKHHMQGSGTPCQ